MKTQPNQPTARLRTTTLLVAASLVSLATVAGCRYQNSPAIETSSGVLQDPNLPTSVHLMSSAVRFVAARYDVQSKTMMEDPAGPLPSEVKFPMAIGCPMGMRPDKYARVAHDIGPACVPLTPAIQNDRSVPIWHVGRVWVRSRTATVDVYRPMSELPPGPDGKPVYSMITVRFEGNYTSPWRAIHARTWSPGDFPTPDSFPMQDGEGGDEFMSGPATQIKAAEPPASK